MLLSLAQLLLYHVLVLMNFLHTDVLKSPFGSVYTFSLLLWIQDIRKSFVRSHNSVIIEHCVNSVYPENSVTA
jgi:hypothetical protein